MASIDAYEEANLRERFLELAASYVGCGYAEQPEHFMDIVAPGEDLLRAQQMATIASTCGLFCRGLLAASGANDRRTLSPYHDGKVMSDLVGMAREAGALVTIAEAEPGDLVMIGAPEHVFVIEDLDGIKLSTIQGGERDPIHHAQQIQRISRTLRAVGATTLVDDRPIEFVISLPVLLARFLP